MTTAMRGRQLVRLARRFERSPVRGYVLDVGPVFVLLAIVSDRIRYDGFECLRIADLRSVAPDPYRTFAEAALRKRGERKSRRPRVVMRRLADLLASAGRAFPLLTIHREAADPGVCQIGRVQHVTRNRLSLLEITPAARWAARPNWYALREITRVSFGGDYEAALHLVGGTPGAASAIKATNSGI